MNVRTKLKIAAFTLVFIQVGLNANSQVRSNRLSSKTKVKGSVDDLSTESRIAFDLMCIKCTAMYPWSKFNEEKSNWIFAEAKLLGYATLYPDKGLIQPMLIKQLGVIKSNSSGIDVSGKYQFQAHYGEVMESDPFFTGGIFLARYNPDAPKDIVYLHSPDKKPLFSNVQAISLDFIPFIQDLSQNQMALCKPIDVWGKDRWMKEGKIKEHIAAVLKSENPLLVAKIASEFRSTRFSESIEKGALEILENEDHPIVIALIVHALLQNETGPRGVLAGKIASLFANRSLNSQIGLMVGVHTCDVVDESIQPILNMRDKVLKKAESASKEKRQYLTMLFKQRHSLSLKDMGFEFLRTKQTLVLQ